VAFCVTTPRADRRHRTAQHSSCVSQHQSNLGRTGRWAWVPIPPPLQALRYVRSWAHHLLLRPCPVHHPARSADELFVRILEWWFHFLLGTPILHHCSCLMYVGWCALCVCAVQPAYAPEVGWVGPLHAPSNRMCPRFTFHLRRCSGRGSCGGVAPRAVPRTFSVRRVVVRGGPCRSMRAHLSFRMCGSAVAKSGCLCNGSGSLCRPPSS
jgi:hypothetical protein